MDRVADAFSTAAARYGSETVWPYFFAGTMGLVQRDGLQRLRHAMRYSRQHSTICTTLPVTGWQAGYGQCWGVPAEEMRQSDLVVIWGGNPVSTQVNVMTHVSRAKKRNGAKLVVVDPYRTGTAEQADLHLAFAPAQMALSLVPSCMSCFAMASPIATIWLFMPTMSTNSRSIFKAAHPAGPLRLLVLMLASSKSSQRSMVERSAPTSALDTASLDRAMFPSMPAASSLPIVSGAGFIQWRCSL